MIDQVSETAKAIKEIGVMEMISAAFLVLSLFFIGYFIFDFKKSVKELIDATHRQNDMLNDISEALRPTLKERVKVIANAYFDLAMFKAMAFIKRLKKENHIDQKEKTVAKIKKWVSTLHSDRNTKFDNFNYRGKSMSAYVNPDWISKVSDVIESEVYDSDPNDDRTFTNMKGVYDDIKIDYYDRANKL